jgi:transposase
MTYTYRTIQATCTIRTEQLQAVRAAVVDALNDEAPTWREQTDQQGKRPSLAELLGLLGITVDEKSNFLFIKHVDTADSRIYDDHYDSATEHALDALARYAQGRLVWIDSDDNVFATRYRDGRTEQVNATFAFSE